MRNNQVAHYARIEDGIVREVIVIDNKDCGGGDYPESNPVGQAFIAFIGLAGHWEQTSYGSNFRGKYAGQGDSFDAELDEFVSPPAPELPVIPAE